MALAFAFAYEPIADGATGSTAAVVTNLADWGCPALRAAPN
jgi:hypothetical protein